MSWSVAPEVKSKPVAEAKEMLGNQPYIPQTIRDYMLAGIDGLVSVHGDDVLVSVTGHGHLCTGKDYDVTSASLEVRKG